jgi:hypothetical protein
MARRTQEGMSKPEIIRCLKRYVAREMYRELTPRVALAGVALTNSRSIAGVRDDPLPSPTRVRHAGYSRKSINRLLRDG